MLIDVQLGSELGDAQERAIELTEAGASGLFTFEGPRDVFFPLVLAAAATSCDLYTNVAIALPRSPMHLAYQAYDLQRLSRGRFALGIGSQIRPHIERRYSALWDKPVAQMKDLIEAVQAIFAAWQDGVPLDHQGPYYTHTLLPPLFNPGPLEWGPPPIWAAAVGPRMTEMVATTADGLLVHPFTTEAFVHERLLPIVGEGLERSGRTRDDFSLVIDVMVCAYRDEAEHERADAGCRFNLGFYGSTPAYRPVLDTHGWGDLQPRLRDLTKAGHWDQLASVWNDEMLSELTVRGTPQEVGAELQRRFGSVATRIGLSMPYQHDDSLIAEIVDAANEPLSD
jgi:probable F420-dependent oxidoreductase